MKTPLANVLLLLLSLLITSVQAADFVVVVSAKSPVAALGLNQVKDIFLGRTPTYPDGFQAIPIEHPDGSELKNAFHSKVTHKSRAQLKAYWSRLVFSGSGTPPKEVPNAEVMKQLIALNPNLIGYVNRALIDNSLKVVYAP